MRKSLILLLAGLLVGLPLMGLGSEKVQAADGYVFCAGGNGSPENPFKIKSAEDLDHVRDDLTASYQLAGDIPLSTDDNWEPIGKPGSPFGGTFDGANYTIRGLKIHSDAAYIGLFGQTAGDSVTIQNVRLKDVDITSTNVHAQVGGLVGSAARGRITNISVSGEIKGKASSAGGLAGQVGTSAALESSRSSVNLTFLSGVVGGLVGSLSSGGTIKLSYATGHVSISGGGMGGGLVGKLDSKEIMESYATGDVTATDNASSGGLVGYSSSVVDGKITNSYAAGSVGSASGSSGGLVGRYVGSVMPGFIENSYWNSDHNPGLTTIGEEPGSIGAISDDQLKDLVAYAGWETAYWGIRQGESYPYLKAFSPVLGVKPLSPVYSAKSVNHELKVDGSIRDGSIGEPVQVGYVITNQATATVVQAVYDAYETYATGEDQSFQFSVMLNEIDYPDGDYTLIVIGADTVEMNEQVQQFTFEVDSTPPEILLSGAELIMLEVGDVFADPGATATDNRDSAVGIVTSGIVDTAQTGTYTLTYVVTDTAGNKATKTRTVKVYNSLYPEVQLNGPSTMEVEAGDEFNDLGAAASDERDGNVTIKIVITGSVDIGRVGTYSIQYNITNSLGNQSSVSRTVEVVDRTPPILTLLGANPMRIEVGRRFVDPGATAVDTVDGNLKEDITVTGAVYTNQVGTYRLTYKVQDHSGNAAVDAVRTVNVVRPSSSSGGEPIGGGQTGGNSSGGQPDGNSTEGGQPDDDNTGSTTPPAIGCSFTDLEKHWGKPGVCEAAKLGIVEGVNAHTFLPNAAVTRTEFAVMLLRALRIEIDNEATALTFSDSDSTPKWAVQAIRTAVAKGILTGYTDGTLKPVQTVNRSEMAAMVSRAMKWQAEKEGNGYFSDETSIPSWARGYVEVARERGVLAGRAGNRFAPAEVATRAEAAVVLLRLWKVLY